jgi:hypothetical protein
MRRDEMTIRLSRTERAALGRYADKHGTSAAGAVRMMVRAYMNSEKRTESPHNRKGGAR